jgi:hypothetical protein
MSNFLPLKLWYQGTIATKLDRASLVYLRALNTLISEVHRCRGDKIHAAHPQTRSRDSNRAPDFLPTIRGTRADIKYWN